MQSIFSEIGCDIGRNTRWLSRFSSGQLSSFIRAIVPANLQALHRCSGGGEDRCHNSHRIRKAITILPGIRSLLIVPINLMRRRSMVCQVSKDSDNSTTKSLWRSERLYRSNPRDRHRPNQLFH